MNFLKLAYTFDTTGRATRKPLARSAAISGARSVTRASVSPSSRMVPFGFVITASGREIFGGSFAMWNALTVSDAVGLVSSRKPSVGNAAQEDL